MSAETKIYTLTEVFGDSFKRLFDNFKSLSLYMLYPILGQFVGIAICLAPTFIISFLSAAGKDMGLSALVPVVLGALIGLPLFCHAFWKYIVRTASLCIISKELIINNQLPDFKVAEEQITKRAGSYIALLLVVSLIYLLAIMPAFLPMIMMINANENTVLAAMGLMIVLTLVCIVLMFLISIRLVIYTVAFALNPTFRAGDAIGKSIELTKGKAGKTFLFVLLVSIVYTVANMIPSMIPFVGSLLSPVIMIIITPLSQLLVTHWYLKLEAEKAAQAI